MAYLNECKCLQPDLKSILQEAVDAMKVVKLAGKEDTTEQAKQSVASLVVTMRKNKIPEETISQMVTNFINALPIDPEVKQFQEIDNYLNQCECPTGTALDWRIPKFHEIGYKITTSSGKGTSFGGIPRVDSLKACENITPEQAENMILRLTEIGKRYYNLPRDKMLLNEMKNDLGGEMMITGGNVRPWAVKKGIISESEMNEFLSIAKKLDECRGLSPGKTLNSFDTKLLAARTEVGLVRKPQPSQLKKK